MLSNRLEADGETITPGSIEDPVVTKSYVDQKLAALSGSGSSGGSTGGSSSGGQTDEGGSTASQQFEVVTVPVGKRIVSLNSAEFVIRSGKALVFSGDTSGLSDLTDGAEIKHGGKVSNDHLMLSARGGRGIQVSPEQTSGSIVVLVRGQYAIQDQPSS